MVAGAEEFSKGEQGAGTPILRASELQGVVPTVRGHMHRAKAQGIN